MKLTTFSDYRLRVLMHLALNRERLATIPEIATAYDISENHLMKVVHQLVRSGVIESARCKARELSRLGKQPQEERTVLSAAAWGIGFGLRTARLPPRNSAPPADVTTEKRRPSRPSLRYTANQSPP